MKRFFRVSFYLIAIAVLFTAIYGAIAAFQSEVYTSADYLLMIFAAAIFANMFKKFGE